MLRRWSLGGVPVLRRPHSKPKDLSDSASSRDGGSPTRPAGRCSRPMWIRPLRNVPVVTTSARQANRSTVLQREAGHAGGIRQDPARAAENPVDVWLGLERPFHPFRYNPCRPEPGRPDCRTAASVQHLELDAGRVDRAPHQSAERIDLPHQVPFGGSTDRRIAGHVGDGAVRQRTDANAAAEACRRPRRFDPGVPRANDDDVKSAGERGSFPLCITNYFPIQNRSKIACSTSSAVLAPVTSSR